MAQIIWHTCSFWVFLLKLPLLLQDGARLIKQRRALLESNSPRNSQREIHRNDELGGGSRVAPRYCYSPDRVVHGLPSFAECRNQVHVDRTNRRAAGVSQSGFRLWPIFAPMPAPIATPVVGEAHLPLANVAVAAGAGGSPVFFPFPCPLPPHAPNPPLLSPRVYFQSFPDQRIERALNRPAEVRRATSDRADFGGAGRLACLGPKSQKHGEASGPDGSPHAPRHGQGRAYAPYAFLPLGPDSTPGERGGEAGCR